MAADRVLAERLNELEQVLVRQADRIAALEDEVGALQRMLIRVLQSTMPPDAQAA